MLLNLQEMSLVIHKPKWEDIYTISKGNVIEKGRRNDLYPAIIGKAKSVKYKCGCYSWGDKSTIFYCGSFTSDLSDRIHNYLQNHRIKPNGRKNTNLMVFEHINQALQQSDVTLRLYVFESIQLNDQPFDFATYSNVSSLVHTVEQLLICFYREHNQCQWNRA